MECHGQTQESRIQVLIDSIGKVGSKVDALENDIQDLTETVALLSLASKGRLTLKNG